MGNGMMQSGEMIGWGGMVFGPYSLLVYGVLAILAVVVLVRLFGRRNTVSGNSLNILNERFAAGEISAEEYKNLKRQIGV